MGLLLALPALLVVAGGVTAVAARGTVGRRVGLALLGTGVLLVVGLRLAVA